MCFETLETMVSNDIDCWYSLERDPNGKLSYDVLIEEYWRDLGIDRFAIPSLSESFAIVE